MATQLFPIGSNKAASADFILTEPTLVFLVTPGGGKAPPGALMELRVKGTTTYAYFDKLTAARPGGILPAGTYQAVRMKGNIGLERV